MSDGMGMSQRPIDVWGYNGSSPGPTIEVTEGDTVRIVFTNGLPEATTVHWHGLHLPIGMDGIPDFSQAPVPPGGTFTYEFTLNQSGTYFYHSHMTAAKQIGLGLMGFFIVHPKAPPDWYYVDHDYLFLLHSWKINPGSPLPDVLEMTEFNYFTMNGQPGPQIPPMAAKVGEKVRIRVTNLSMLAHPVHLHGHTFKVTELGAGFLPPYQHLPMNTVSVSAAEVRAFDFIADRPGKWLFHCHFTHHTMNDMHRTPLPSDPTMAGMNMDMGGMHTWIEVS
jgi:FtsP/CotA-like multicopper oxidase with cupredoxin domain